MNQIVWLPDDGDYLIMGGKAVPVDVEYLSDERAQTDKRTPQEPELNPEIETLVSKATFAMARLDGPDVTFEELARIAVAIVMQAQYTGAIGRATRTAMEEQLIAAGWGECASQVVEALIPTLEAAGHGDGCMSPARADELLHLVESVMEENDRARGKLAAVNDVVEGVMNGLTAVVMKGVQSLLKASGPDKKETTDGASDR